MGKLDVARSVVRSFADEVGERLAHTTRWPRLQEIAKRLKERAVIVSEEALVTAMTGIEDISELSINCVEGKILIDATLNDGQDLRGAIIPQGVFFAPRGAKEVKFRVEPTEASPLLRKVVGALCSTIASGTWPIIAGQTSRTGAFVDVEANGILRADLRTVPAVNKYMQTGAASLIFDILELKGIWAVEGGLRLKLGTPAFATS